MNETDSIATQKPPSKALKKLQVMLFSAVCGAVIGYLAVVWLVRPRSPMLPLASPGLLLLSLLPIWFFVILIHELGHVFGGWLCGHRFYMLIIGPLRITRDMKGLRAQFNGTFALTGGLAVCLPASIDHFVRDRKVVVAMGPIASVLLALTSWFSAWSLSYLRSSIVDVLTVTALFSALASCISLAPSRAGGFPSDGSQLWRLFRGGADVEKLTLVIMLQTLSISGTRPRDWPEELLDRAIALKSNQAIYDALAELMAYNHYLDRQLHDIAQTYLEKAMSKYDDMPNGARQGFAVEAAYFWAYHRQDLGKATQWLDRGRGGLVEPAVRSRVEAAVLSLKGEVQPALEKIRQARVQLPFSIDRGGAVVEHEMLDAMETSLTTPVVST